MLTKEKIESYRQSAIKGITKSIFKELDNLITDPIHKEQLDSLSAQWNAFTREKITGVLSYSEKVQRENIIRHSLLALLQEIENEIPEPEPDSDPNPIQDLSHLRQALNRPLKKLALVMGCNDYKYARTLKNAVNDANGMSQALQTANFEVSKGLDLTYTEMVAAIDQFGAKANQYDIALVYFAGHGMEINGENYLIPVDANPRERELFDQQCVKLTRLLGYMEENKAAANVIILDACRNNPSRDANGVELTRGFVKENAPSGSLIAYSTAPTKVASDGEHLEHGLYTNELLNWIEQKNLVITELLINVGREVSKASNNKQVPWQSLSLNYNFSLHD